MRRVEDRSGHLVSKTRLADCLHIQRVFRGSERVAAQIQSVQAGGQIVQRHQILPVGTNVGGVVIDGILVAANFPA